MAAIAPTVVDVSMQGDNSTLRVTWTPVTEVDTCNPARYPQYFSKSMHVFGTFSGTSVSLNGSNNGGASYVPLDDPAGLVIAINQEGIEQVSQNTELVQPVLTGGAGVSLTIVMLLQMPNPFRT